MAADFSLPASISIKSCRFSLEHNSQSFVSPLNGYQQRRDNPGARWTVAYTLTAQNRASIAATQAFLVGLQGSLSTFAAYDPLALATLGTSTGTPLVNGTSQTGSSLITDGWSNSTAILKAGDYISVNDELKMVTADVSSDGSGNATIAISPALRNSPSEDAVITVANCTAIMSLVNGSVEWSESAGGVYSVTFSGVEVLS